MKNSCRRLFTAPVRLLCRRKGRAVLACMLAATMLLTGCWSSRELDQLAIVMAVGLDEGKEQEQVMFTAQVAKATDMQAPSASGGSTSEGNAYTNVRMEGKSVFGAIRDMTHKISRKLYFSHNQIIIVSNDLAKRGFVKELDMFLRNYETRMDTLLLVSRDRADEILEEEPKLDNLPATHIYDLLHTQFANSQTAVVTVREFSTCILSGTTAPVAPIIEVVEEKEQKKARLSGTAVFKDGKVVGELDDDQTRGLLWVKGKVHSGIMYVEAPGGEVTMEILRSKRKIKPYKNENGEIAIRIDVSEESIIASAETSEDLSKKEIPALLEENMGKVIEAEIQDAITTSKSLNCDIFGFGEQIHQKFPKEWEQMEPQWDTLYPKLQIDVHADTKLRGMGGLLRQISPGGNNKA